MDWVHCNVCFAQLEPGLSLHLTSCGHMFCDNCLDNGVKGGRCKICQNPCTTMKLIPDMKQEVQDFFTDPEEIVGKLSSILEFQRKHRLRLTAYRLQMGKKYKAAKEEIKRLYEIAQKLNSALKDLHQKYRALKCACANREMSPFLTPVSINSPTMTPTLSKPAKSTPYPGLYQSNLVTPTRLRQNRSFQKYPTSMSSTMSPRTPPSAGYNAFLQHL